MDVTEVTHDEAVDVTYYNRHSSDYSSHTNFGIVDLSTVDWDTTVVKRKIITIPGGIACLSKTITSTAGVEINNLNIYNRTILL